MSFIRLHKTNQSGEYVGDFVVNSEHIVQISPPMKAIGTTTLPALPYGLPVPCDYGSIIDNATQISTVDGKTHWVQETVDQVFDAIRKG